MNKKEYILLKLFIVIVLMLSADRAWTQDSLSSKLTPDTIPFYKEKNVKEYNDLSFLGTTARITDTLTNPQGYVFKDSILKIAIKYKSRWKVWPAIHSSLNNSMYDFEEYKVERVNINFKGSNELKITTEYRFARINNLYGGGGDQFVCTIIWDLDKQTCLFAWDSHIELVEWWYEYSDDKADTSDFLNRPITGGGGYKEYSKREIVPKSKSELVIQTEREYTYSKYHTKYQETGNQEDKYFYNEATPDDFIIYDKREGKPGVKRGCVVYEFKKDMLIRVKKKCD